MTDRKYHFKDNCRGGSKGGRTRRAPPKIGKTNYFFAWNRDFSHEIPPQFSRLPPLGAIFLSAPPPYPEILDQPWIVHSIFRSNKNPDKGKEVGVGIIKRLIPVSSFVHWDTQSQRFSWCLPKDRDFTAQFIKAFQAFLLNKWRVVPI